MEDAPIKPPPVKKEVADPDPKAPNPLDRPCGPVRKPFPSDPPMEEDPETPDE